MSQGQPPERGRRESTPPRGRGAPRRDNRGGPRTSRPDAEDPGRSLGAPTGARTPVGLDRAKARAGALPRPGRESTAPPRPELPEDEEPQLPKGVRREIDRVIGRSRRGSDIALALSIGAAAIDEERLDVALPMLAWVKHEAPRIAAVREAYGVALYLDEQFAAALSELQAYKRISGQVDQNHLIADCLRALDRGVDRIVDAAAELVHADGAPEDRRAEAAIVWASALADDGDVGAGRAVLRAYLQRAGAGQGEHVLRARYALAELAARDGDPRDAAEHYRTVLAIDPDFLDVSDRIDALEA
ncbi:hypothetical protein [Egicoccus sp. AB-alg6-2]|uniref:hypothetical protein n=1 Tax=Egicoccus sp. AB-alg6-2 TaxID=3242692 RepID=UPI00359E947F